MKANIRKINKIVITILVCLFVLSQPLELYSLSPTTIFETKGKPIIDQLVTLSLELSWIDCTGNSIGTDINNDIHADGSEETIKHILEELDTTSKVITDRTQFITHLSSNYYENINYSVKLIIAWIIQNNRYADDHFEKFQSISDTIEDPQTKTILRLRAAYAMADINDDKQAIRYLMDHLSHHNPIIRHEALFLVKELLTKKHPRRFMRYLTEQELVYFINEFVQKCKLYDPWTKISDFMLLEEAIWQLLHEKYKQRDFDTEKLHSTFIHKETRKLFHAKKYMPTTNRDTLSYPAHHDRHNPFREILVATIGKNIKANTAETLITDTQTYSALSITTNPDSLPQKTREKAEAAHLVLSVFVRLWDISDRFFQKSPTGNTFVYFDFDESLIPECQDIEKYESILKDFVLRGNHSHWNEGDIDKRVLMETIERVRKLDIDSIVGDIDDNISPNISRDELIAFLKHTKEHIEEDTLRIYKLLVGHDLLESDHETYESSTVLQAI